jgi:hypothetical protein
MKFVVVTQDSAVAEAATLGFHPSDECVVLESWTDALELAGDADLLFVDMLATLTEPNKIAGYEAFAKAKMNHPASSKTPLVVISPPDSYELDFMAGWPNFLLGNVQRPVDYKIFRRASTWV